MSEKIAAGLIIFRRSNDTIEYLLLQHSYGDRHWTSPKGHVDPGEEELTAAIRETEEEAGISIDKDFKLLSQTFKIETCYLIKGKFPKKVIYWIAEASETANIKLSHEHTGFKWLTLKETLDIVGFEATKEVFIKADDFIRKNNQHSQNKQFRI